MRSYRPHLRLLVANDLYCWEVVSPTLTDTRAAPDAGAAGVVVGTRFLLTHESPCIRSISGQCYSPTERFVPACAPEVTQKLLPPVLLRAL